MKKPWSRTNLIAVAAKTSSKEDFLKIYPLPEDKMHFYDLLKNAKVGKISITQTMGNKTGFQFEGYTATFSEGLSLFIDTDSEYYYTSGIEKINWEKGYFDTMNSRYQFTFELISEDEL